MARNISHLHWEKAKPGDYVVKVGDAQCFDAFHFPTERDAQRFVNASRYSFKCERGR